MSAIPHGEMSKLIRDHPVWIALYKNNCLGNYYYYAPNEVYDYQMNGVPVIASNYPGLLKVIEGGKLGVCVNEVDLSNFRGAFELIKNKHRREKITQEVRHKYSWQVQTPGLLDLFH